VSIAQRDSSCALRDQPRDAAAVLRRAAAVACAPAPHKQRVAVRVPNGTVAFVRASDARRGDGRTPRPRTRSGHDGKPANAARSGPSGARGRTPARPAQGRAVPCAHFPQCVGCPLVGDPYPAQLVAKGERLRAAIARHPELADARIDEPAGSPAAFGYRNQAKLVFRGRFVPGVGRQILLGVYRPGTHSVVPAEACIVHHRLLQPLLRDLRAEVERLAMPIFDERDRSGALRYALVRASTARGEVHLTLVSAIADPPGLDELLRRLRRGHRELTATFLCVNPTPGNTILSPDIRLLHGRPVLVERFGDLELESRPDAFLQANSAVAARIYATALRLLAPAPGDVALDLYCGVGALALHVAPHVARVIGIEAQESAVACAIANARRAGARAAEFVAAPAEDARRVLAERGVGAVSLVMVNPPRKGLSAAVLATVADIAPRRILYVSCDPTTLARDLAALAAHGYRTRRVRAFDMLPQTPHVEAVALLERDRGV
jgi:23S rRNA (uracil1939-C5)-methyltransferase